MKKIAVLLENLFDEQEVIYPYHRLREDYEVVLVGTEGEKKYKSKSDFKLESHIGSNEVNPDEFDGVFIPGGFSPDYMRSSEDTVKLVKKIYEAKKPVAAICHGGWMLAEADIINGKTVTSTGTIKTDLKNAGANWVDEEVVVDENIITGRNPNDLPAVVKAFVEMIEK